MPLEFHEFRREDFKTYQSWFADQFLNDSLGPAVDEEWLNFILGDRTGIQYVVTLNREMVAVVGLVKPKVDFAFWTITDIAVKPALRKQGIASRVVTALSILLKETNIVAFVMPENEPAIRLFSSLDWSRDLDDSSKMWKFTMPDKPMHLAP